MEKLIKENAMEELEYKNGPSEESLIEELLPHFRMVKQKFGSAYTLKALNFLFKSEIKKRDQIIDILELRG